MEFSFGKFFLSAALFLSVSASVYAQNCVPLFKGEYDADGAEETRAVLHTPDNGAIVIGRTNSDTPGDWDGFILKLTETGDISWSKKYRTEGNEIFNHIRRSADGGYIILGLRNPAGGSDEIPFLLKITEEGSVIWSRDLKPEGSRFQTTDLLVGRDGNLFVTINKVISATEASAFLLKFDPSGNYLWGKEYSSTQKDRFDCLIQKGDTIVVGGESKLSHLTHGVILKMNPYSGELLQRLSIEKGPQDEYSEFNQKIVSLHTLANGGLAFNLAYSWVFPDEGMGSTKGILQAKMTNDQQVFYCSLDLSTHEDMATDEKPTIRLSADSSFATLKNDPNYPHSSVLSVFGQSRIQNFNMLNGTDAERKTFIGLDTVPGNGFLIAGNYKARYIIGDPFAVKTETIRVMRVNQQISSGNCSYNLTTTGNTDSGNVRIHPIALVMPGTPNNFQNAQIFWDISPDIFRTKELCKSTYCLEQTSLPDQCNQNFHLRLRGAQTPELLDAVRKPDGSILAVGSYSYSNNTQPMAMGIAPNGEAVWTHVFTEFSHTGYLTHVIPLRDGNYFTFGTRSYDRPHAADTRTIMAKINKDGGILWAREMLDNSLISGTCLEMENGDVVLLGGMQRGYPSQFFYVTRLNASGDVVWKREIERYSNEPYVARNGNTLYLLSGNDYSGSLTLDKINLESGTSYWEKRFGGNSSSNPGYFETGGITVQNDSLYLNYFYRTPELSGTVAPGVLVLDLEGTQIKNFSYPDLSGRTKRVYTQHFEPKVWSHTADGNFMLAFETGPATNLVLQVTKIKPDGSIIWSKKYPGLKDYNVVSIRPDGNNMLITGQILPMELMYLDRTADRSFILSLDSEGKITTENTGICEAQDVIAGVETAPFLLEWIIPIMEKLRPTEQYRIPPPAAMISIPGKVISNLICDLPDQCATFNMTGTNKICDPSIEYVYTFTKGAGCMAIPILDFDKTAIDLIEQNETGVRFRFKKGGRYTITARLETGCKILESSIETEVVDTPEGGFLGKDTTLCDLDSFVLKAPPFMSRYNWQDGSTLDSLVARQSGTYRLEVEDFCGQIWRDEIELVIPVLPELNLGADTSICEGKNVTITAAPGYNSYTWSTGSTSRQITVSAAGKYIVEAVHTSGCNKSDTLEIKSVYSLPRFDLGNPVLCANNPITIGLSSSTNSYRWNTGETSSFIQINQPGTYWLELTDQNGCQFSDTVNLPQRALPKTDFLPKQAEICKEGGTIELSSSIPFSSYQWNTGSSSRSITVTRNGQYTLTGTDSDGCTHTEMVEVVPVDCLLGVYFPSAFSPNGDQKNDVFRALVYGQPVMFHLTVYNRFGEKVFETTDHNKGWDGNFRGKSNDSNTFVWTCTYQLAGQEKESKKGIILMVR